MRNERGWTGMIVVVGLALCAAATPGRAADKGAQCAAAKLTAASKYAACRLKADAKVAKGGGSADYSKCDTKFLKSFERAEAKAGAGVCPSEGNESSVSSCLARVTSECTPLMLGCDGTGDCNTCSQCAQASGGPCYAAAQACLQDPECVAFSDCVNLCEDQACIDLCISSYPNGVNPYSAAVSCIICDTCPNDCDAVSFGCTQ